MFPDAFSDKVHLYNPQKSTMQLKSSKAQIILAEDLKLKSHSMLETVHFLCFLMMDDFERSLIHFWQC